jgi:drug/metabolite transporter (DMT)-like permease
MADRSPPSRAGVFRLAALALIWGSGFLWIKLALRGFDPVQITFGRLLLGVLTLAPIVVWQRLRLPAGWRIRGHLIAVALVANAIPYVLFGVAERTIDSNVAGVINATTPLWTLFLGFLVGVDRSLTARKAAGFAVGFVGVLVLFAPWRSAGEIASWGGLACLLAAASYGVGYVYMGRHLMNQGISPLMLSACQLAAATVLLALAMPIAGRDAPTWRWDAVASLAVLGVLGTGVAYVLSYRIIQDEGPLAASTVTYLVPLAAVGLGWTVLREPITITVGAGMALVLLGVALTRNARPAAVPAVT